MVDQVTVPTSEDELHRLAGRIGESGDGIVRFLVAMPGDFVDFVRRADAGDYDSQIFVRSWIQFRKAIAKQPRGSRTQCSLCARSLKPRSMTFGLAVPYGIDNPPLGMMFGICERCAPDRAAADVAGHWAVENVYPGMRSLGAPMPAGHA